MKTVLLGITGGIAAFKMLEVASDLKKQGVNVIVIMTPSATMIVPPKKFEDITGNNVYTQLFTNSFDYRKILKSRIVDHVAIAKQASLFVIAPATANNIAKLANGIADDYITTTALAVKCPVLIFPSMNTGMWNHPATQQNVTKLQSLGYIIVEPDSGKLACGDEGKGRLPHVSIIETEINKLLQKTDDLNGKTVIITSGGTMEKIDDIRFITNKSSGKMGASLADACFLRGANVILFRAKTSIVPRYPHEEYLFETADELEQLFKKYLHTADICIHAAAVSDYTIKNPIIGKSSSDKPLPLELTPRSKILDKIKVMNPHIFLVAFKAEWNLSQKKLIELSSKRLIKASADMIIANDVSHKEIGFGSDENEVEIIDSKSVATHIPRTSKIVIANLIVDRIVTELA